VQPFKSITDSVTPARPRRAVPFMLPRFAGALGFACFGCVALSHGVRADDATKTDALKPVHLWIAGREVSLKEPALADNAETYVPLEALNAVGAKGKLNARADAILLTTITITQPLELALARPNGRRMIALSDLARALKADIVRTELMGDDGKPIPHSKGDTVYLLAHITDIHYANGAIHVSTSFAVPYHAQMRDIQGTEHGTVDCVGATVPATLHPAPLPTGTYRLQPARLLAAQYSIDTARITLDFPRSVQLPTADGVIATSGADVALAGRRTNKTIAQRPAGRNQSPQNNGADRVARADVNAGPKTPDAGRKIDNIDNTAGGAVQRPGGLNGEEGMPPADDKEADAQADQADADTANQAGQNADTAARSALPSRSITFQRGGAVEVRGVMFVPQDDTRVRIDIMTTGRAASMPHYLDNGKLVIDIPNAVLNVPDPNSPQQNFNHPLLTGIHAELLQQNPPVTRITLDTPRVVGFTVNTQSDRVSIDVRMPRNSGGVLADKVIVIDPGHGGSSTGATSAGVIEKDLTLGISLKLRAYLEAAGVKVVMTRDRDAAVPLYDRPRLANAINADLFVSVHIDDVDRANSASGTSTYYHKTDASSHALAVCVQREVMTVTGLPSRGALSDGILYASGLAVLRCSAMPAILIEVGYINNQRDRRKLVDEEFQDRVARAICEGLRHYVEGSPETVRRTPSSASIKGGNDQPAQAVARLSGD
jgi:N-acetylmuramoyl-L-alanine amidase